MQDNKYFNKALSSMVADFAYVEAIRHLYDIGYDPQAIQKELLYPISVDRIEEVIREYEIEKQSPDSEYEYVERTDAYGRKSFIRVKKNTK